MPDYFSHSVIAEKVLERLDGKIKKKIISKPLYLTGAQGGDVFFAYSMKFSASNAGRRLHSTDARELFLKIKGGNFSYLSGFATHYALDCTLHPAVYSYQRSARSFTAHRTFESDLGLFISRYFRIRRSILPREKLLECTYGVYDTMCGALPEITVTGVERCLKRYFNYTRYTFKTKRQSYKCNYDFSCLTGAIEEAVDLGVKCISSLYFGEVDPELFDKEFLQK